MIIFVCIIYMVKMLLSTGHFSTLKKLFFVHLLIVMSDAGRLCFPGQVSRVAGMGGLMFPVSLLGFFSLTSP